MWTDEIHSLLFSFFFWGWVKKNINGVYFIRKYYFSLSTSEFCLIKSAISEWNASSKSCTSFFSSNNYSEIVNNALN